MTKKELRIDRALADILRKIEDTEILYEIQEKVSRSVAENISKKVKTENERLLLGLIAATNVKVAANRRIMYLSFKQNELILDALVAYLDTKTNDKKTRELARRVQKMRKEQAVLLEKYNKIEPIVNGIESIVNARVQSIEACSSGSPKHPQLNNRE